MPHDLTPSFIRPETLSVKTTNLHVFDRLEDWVMKPGCYKQDQEQNGSD